MAQKMSLLYIVLVFVMVTLGCEPLQQAAVTPILSSTPTDAIAPPDTPTLVPTLDPTLTLTSIPFPDPTTTTQSPGDIGPFRYVASLAGLLMNSTEEVQVHTLADGSVWIITSQMVCRWDVQACEVVLSGSEDMLAAVDDDGRLWVLHQDTREIAAWQDGHWTTYADDSGWTNAGDFEKNWWSPTAWSVYSGVMGRLWVPMARDVRAFDGNRWNLYTLEDMGFPIQEMEDISTVHILAVVEDSVEVWVGECNYSGPGPMGRPGRERMPQLGQSVYQSWKWTLQGMYGWVLQMSSGVMSTLVRRGQSIECRKHCCRIITSPTHASSLSTRMGMCG